jgi:hypothetical protein
VHTIVPGDVVDQSRRCVRAIVAAGHLDVARLPATRGRITGGLDHLVDPASERWGETGEGVAALDGLEERGLLAVEVLVGSLEDHQVDTRTPFGFLDLDDCGPEALDDLAERRLEPEHDPVGADRDRGDQRPFDHHVRVQPQDGAVLERSWFTLGAVDHDRRRNDR